MTNKQIKKHKESLCTIIMGINIPENEPENIRLEKLYEVIKKLQKLADDVCACKYYGTALRDISDILDETKERIFPSKNELQTKKYAELEDIYKEICRNIYNALQTEEMFNACVSAKWSCFCAAVAAIAACVSIVLVFIVG